MVSLYTFQFQSIVPDLNKTETKEFYGSVKRKKKKICLFFKPLSLTHVLLLTKCYQVKNIWSVTFIALQNI